MTNDTDQSLESAERFWADRIRGPDGPPSQGPPKAEDFFCLRFEPDRLGC